MTLPKGNITYVQIILMKTGVELDEEFPKWSINVI